MHRSISIFAILTLTAISLMRCGGDRQPRTVGQLEATEISTYDEASVESRPPEQKLEISHRLIGTWSYCIDAPNAGVEPLAFASRRKFYESSIKPGEFVFSEELFRLGVCQSLVDVPIEQVAAQQGRRTGRYSLSAETNADESKNITFEYDSIVYPNLYQRVKIDADGTLFLGKLDETHDGSSLQKTPLRLRKAGIPFGGSFKSVSFHEYAGY